MRDDRTRRNTAFYNLRMQKPQLSVPVPHLRFTRSTQRVLTEDVVEDNKDTATKTKIECIYENKCNVIRICNNVVSFENKFPAPDVNTFEFCDRFSYKGGGCLKLITRDQRLYHR